MSQLRRLAIIIILVYLGFGLLLFINQKSYIYFPDKQSFADCAGFSDYEKRTFNSTRFYYQKTNPDKVLIYYHGNAGSACDRAEIKHLFENKGYSLIFVEYAGYSNDNKKPSRNLFLANAVDIANFVRQEKFSEVVVYGQSLGASIASYYSTIAPTDALILVSPFSSLTELAQSLYPFYPVKFLLREKYDNLTWTKNFQGRLLILHGEQDQTIPPHFSRQLFDSINTTDKNYFFIPNANHNNLWFSSIFQTKIQGFLQK